MKKLILSPYWSMAPISAAYETNVGKVHWSREMSPCDRWLVAPTVQDTLLAPCFTTLVSSPYTLLERMGTPQDPCFHSNYIRKPFFLAASGSCTFHKTRYCIQQRDRPSSRDKSFNAPRILILPNLNSTFSCFLASLVVQIFVNQKPSADHLIICMHVFPNMQVYSYYSVFLRLRRLAVMYT